MKLIELSKNGKTHKGKYFAKVDDEDYDMLRQYNWSVNVKKNSSYAVTMIGDWRNNKQIKMHTMIMGVADSEKQVDHIDHDGLNCQKYNLRIVTNQQNGMNRRAQKNSSSKYIGVGIDNSTKKKWKAYIGFNDKLINIGRYFTEEEAAKARDEKAKELFGEFANLNFPNA